MKILYICPRIHYNFLVHKKAIESFAELDIYESLFDKTTYSKDKTIVTKSLKKNPRYNLPHIITLNKLITKKYDIIIIKELKTITSMTALFIAKMKGIRTMVMIQKIKDMDNFLNRPTNCIVRSLTKNQVALSVTSVGLKDIKKYKFVKSYYIPFGIDKEKIIKIFKASDKLKVITVIKAQKRKNLELLIDALDQISKKYRLKIELTVCWVIYDNDYAEQMKNKAKSSNITIRFKEGTKHKDMKKQYLASDLYILPSYDEPAAFSHLEAMSFGLPTICSDENGTSNYILQGKNGEIFLARDIESLKRSITKVAMTKNKIDWNKLKRYGKNSVDIARRNHSKEALTKEFKRLFDTFND